MRDGTTGQGENPDEALLAEMAESDPSGLPRWKVSVTVVREVAAMDNNTASEAVCGPLRATFGGGEIGITDVRCTRL